MKMTSHRFWITAALAAVIWMGGASALFAFPATVDSDVYGYVVSPEFRTNFVFAGRLQLALKPHSTTLYTGTLFDYEAQHPYPASVDVTNAAAPRLVVYSLNGRFIFTLDSNFGSSFYSGTSASVPPTINSSAPAYFSASNHSSTTVVYNVILSQRVGIVARPFEIKGQLTINYDANNRVSGGTTYYMDSRGRAFHGLVTGTGYYSSSYLYLQAKFGAQYFGIAGTFSGTSWTGNAFTGAGRSTRIWVVSGTP